MKKDWKIYALILVCLLLGGLVSYLIFGRVNGTIEEPLPEPELSEGLRGKYGIDKNINEQTIDNYLNRSDTVYRDVRMLEDTANWEAKGGKRELTGYIEGFEVIPAPYLASYTEEYVAQKASENVTGLYTGDTLFTYTDDGEYIPNYEESMDILEAIFPKDKNIFIMCGAGGYAGQIKNMLVKLGWDEDKVRDVGGFWYYEGEHTVQVERTTEDGKTVYDFSKVPYYNIEFDKLTEIK